LTWGVTPVVIPAYNSMDTMVHAALRAAQATDLVTVGDLTVVVGGGPSAPLGQADFLHLITMPT
jgi:pyruvate kinase